MPQYSGKVETLISHFIHKLIVSRVLLFPMNSKARYLQSLTLSTLSAPILTFSLCINRLLDNQLSFIYIQIWIAVTTPNQSLTRDKFFSQLSLPIFAFHHRQLHTCFSSPELLLRYQVFFVCITLIPYSQLFPVQEFVWSLFCVFLFYFLQTFNWLVTSTVTSSFLYFLFLGNSSFSFFRHITSFTLFSFTAFTCSSSFSLFPKLLSPSLFHPDASAFSPFSSRTLPYFCCILLITSLFLSVSSNFFYSQHCPSQVPS